MWGWWNKSFRKKRRKAAPKPEVFDLVIGTYRKRWRQWVEILASFIGVFALTKSINFIVPGGQPGVASLTGMAVFLILEKASSFRFAKSKIYLQQGRTEESFKYGNLNVEGPTSYTWKTDEYLVFWDDHNTFYLNNTSYSSMLSAEAVWVLAELQQRGANIWVAGFGSYEYPEPPKHIDKYKAAQKPLSVVALFSLLVAVGFIFAGFAGKISFLNLGPLLLLVPLFWIANYVRKLLAKHGEPEADSNSVEVTEEEVLVYKRWKIQQRVKLEEIKTVFVTIEPKTFNRLRISVEIQTHYARSFKLIDGGSALSYSHCLFLENARALGMHIVYRRIVKGSGEMVVIHEVDPSAQIMQFGETYKRDLLSQFVQTENEIKEEA